MGNSEYAGGGLVLTLSGPAVGRVLEDLIGVSDGH
jgi:hypothetical protein